MDKDKNIQDIFSEIYEKYIDSIYKFIFLKTPSKEIAQDLTSEVFTKFIHYLQKGNTANNPRAFLYKIARNTITDYYRKNSKIEFVEAKESIANPLNLEDKVSAKIDVEMIKKKLGKISTEYQDIIILYYLEELPVKEIADILGKTENNVRVIIHRALKVIREDF